MSERFKPLTFAQAQNCETAREPVCKCRCGGAMHGAARGTGDQLELRGFYEKLEDDDPHRIPSEKERKDLNEFRSMRNSYLQAKKRYPRAWTLADERNLSLLERKIIRLERVVLGIQHPEAAHA